MARVAVAIATMNRRDELLAVLDRLAAVPDDVEIIVADNASTDGSGDAVEARFPQVRLVRLEHNIGCAARNVAATHTTAEYVAFSDDDSWWAPGALTRAAETFDAHPRLALVAGRILVGEEERLDPVCELMAAGPVRRDDLPGPSITGFIACGAVVRRTAFLAAGGFCERFVIAAEENLLAWDLKAAGWELAYVDGVVAHHHPSTVRDVGARRHREIRNNLWTSWLRRPAPIAAAATAKVAMAAAADPVARAAFADAVRHGGWALAGRRRNPRWLEQQLAITP